jgi:hypothetical protein
MNRGEMIEKLEAIKRGEMVGFENLIILIKEDRIYKNGMVEISFDELMRSHQSAANMVIMLDADNELSKKIKLEYDSAIAIEVNTLEQAKDLEKLMDITNETNVKITE